MDNVGTSNNQNMGEITAQSIMDNMKLYITDCPIKIWMCKEGFDPDNGCVLVFPISFQVEFCFPIPNYIRFSEYIDRPYLYRESIVLWPYGSPAQKLYGGGWGREIKQL